MEVISTQGRQGLVPVMAGTGTQQRKVFPCLMAAVPLPMWHRAVWDIWLSIIYPGR